MKFRTQRQKARARARFEAADLESRNDLTTYELNRQNRHTGVVLLVSGGSIATTDYDGSEIGIGVGAAPSAADVVALADVETRAKRREFYTRNPHLAPWAVVPAGGSN